MIKAVKLRLKLVALVIFGALALAAFPLANSATAGAVEVTQDQDTAQVQGPQGRVRVQPHIMSTTIKFNKRETRAISQNGGHVAEALTGASLVPALAPYAGAFALAAGHINSAADDAVASGKCLQIKMYRVGPPVPFTSSYRC